MLQLAELTKKGIELALSNNGIVADDMNFRRVKFKRVQKATPLSGPMQYVYYGLFTDFDNECDAISEIYVWMDYVAGVAKADCAPVPYYMEDFM